MDKLDINEKDLLEMELFLKFNNQFERETRHIDQFFIDEPSLTPEDKRIKMERNLEFLVKDTKEQIEKNKYYFDLNLFELYRKVDPIFNELIEGSKMTTEDEIQKKFLIDENEG